MKLSSEELDTLRELATLNPDERAAIREAAAPIAAKKRQLREAEAKISAKMAEVEALRAKLPELQERHREELQKVYEASRLFYTALGDARETKALLGAALEDVKVATNIVQGMRTGLDAMRRDNA